MDHKQKYLKYKKKYLNLQKESSKLQLIGGAKCPTIGFVQHSGECWHDALSTIMLYSDNVADHIQRIFDTNGGHTFKVDDCISSAIRNNPLPLPFNIEEKDMKSFIESAEEYIRNLYHRYNNEKLKPQPYVRMPIRLSEADSEAALRREATSSTGRPRRNSYNESLLCTRELFHFTNINLINGTRWYEHSHLGTDLHYSSIINLFNYFLLNYYPRTLQVKKEPAKYLSFEIFDLSKIMFLSDARVILANIDEILAPFKELLKLFNDNLCGILCSLIPQKAYFNFTTTGKLENTSGHAVSFFTCDGEDKFYDNNGVETQGDIDPEVSEDEEEPESEINPGPPDEIHIRIQPPSRNTLKSFKPYEWRSYFLERISSIIAQLEYFKISSPTDETIVDEYKKNILSLSDLFTGSSDTPICGRNYLKKFLIKDLRFVIKNNYTKKEYLDYYTRPNNLLFMYSNERIQDLYLSNFNFVISDNDNINLMLISYLLNICQFSNNMNLFYLLLTKVKRVNEGNVRLESLLSFIQSSAPPFLLA
jgi:hypothetical protein